MVFLQNQPRFFPEEKKKKNFNFLNPIFPTVFQNALNLFLKNKPILKLTN